MPHPDYPDSGTCETCKWARKPCASDIKHLDLRDDSLFCRRHPPLYLPTHRSNDGGPVALPALTWSAYWCGEYAPKQTTGDRND